MLILSIFSTFLYAERSGPYFGLGYGLGDLDDDGSYSEQGFTQVIEHEAQSPYLYAGAFINENLSVELDYLAFEDVIAEDAAGKEIQDSVTIISVVAVAHYPVLDDQLDLFGRFGAGQVLGKEGGDVDRDYNEAALLFGAGLGYRPTKRLTFKIGYDRFSYDKISTISDDAQKSSTVIDFFYGALEVQF